MQEVWIEFLREAIPAMITIMIILGIGFGGVLIVLFYQWIAKKLDLVDKSEPKANPNLKACLDHGKSLFQKDFDCEEKIPKRLKVLKYRLVNEDYIIYCKDNYGVNRSYVFSVYKSTWHTYPKYKLISKAIENTLNEILEKIKEKEKKSK